MEVRKGRKAGPVITAMPDGGTAGRGMEGCQSEDQDSQTDNEFPSFLPCVLQERESKEDTKEKAAEILPATRTNKKQKARSVQRLMLHVVSAM